MENSRLPKPVNFSLRGFLKLVRFPNLLIIAFTQYMTAVFLVGENAEGLRLVYDPNLLLLVLSTVFIAAAGYIINDYYDVKIDFINKPNRVVVGKVLKRRIVMAAHSLLNVTGILIALSLSLWVGFISLVSAFLLWLYSNQLKRLPLVGNLSVAMLTGGALFIVAVYFRENAYLINTYAFFAFSITLIREIIKDMEDLKGDANFGCKTLPVLFGIRKTKMLLYILISGFIFTMFYLSIQLGNTTLIFYFILLIFPIFYFIYYLVKADTIKHFAFLSNYCKILMLSGILSMVFF